MFKNVSQDATETREECYREERSPIRQCTYNSLNEEEDEGEITVSLALFIHV